MHGGVDIQSVAGHWSAVLTKSDPSAGGHARAKHPPAFSKRRGSQLHGAAETFPTLTFAFLAAEK